MISVQDSRELQAAVLAMKAADRGLRTEINRATVATIGPVWKQVVQANATRPMDARVLAVGVRVKAGNPPVAMAANSKRAVGRSKRLVPADRFRGYEFGVGNPNAFSRYTRRSRNGGTHQVERRTMRHLPRFTKTGRVVYPAFADIGPRVVSLWVQLIVEKYNNAAEGKS